MTTIKRNENFRAPKFNGEGVVEFESFSEGFYAEADKRKCKHHFEWTEEEIKEDKSVPEEEFKETRICPLGEELEHATKSKLAKIGRINEKYEKQSERVAKNYPKDKALQKLTDLLNDKENEVEKIESGFEKAVSDVKSAGDQFDKREALFKEGRANARTLLMQMLGPSPNNMIYNILKNVGPKNAWKHLVDFYDDESQTDIYLNSVTMKMSALKFSSGKDC